MGQPSLSTEVCVNTQPSLHSRVRARCPSILLVLPSVSAATTGIWTPSISTYIFGMVCWKRWAGRVVWRGRFPACPAGRFPRQCSQPPVRWLWQGTSRPAKPASVRGPARTASRRPASPPCALHRVKTPARQYPVRHRQDAVLWSNVNTGSRDAGPRQCRPPKERTWPAFP